MQANDLCEAHGPGKIAAVVPAKAGTHTPREMFGEDSSFGTTTIRN
jgi:hypothetical protein